MKNKTFNKNIQIYILFFFFLHYLLLVDWEKHITGIIIQNWIEWCMYHNINITFEEFLFRNFKNNLRAIKIRQPSNHATQISEWVKGCLFTKLSCCHYQPYTICNKNGHIFTLCFTSFIKICQWAAFSKKIIVIDKIIFHVRSQVMLCTLAITIKLKCFKI